MMLKTSLLHGLTSLFRFRGRDERRLFWPFTGCAVGLAVLIWQCLLSTVVREQGARIEALAAEHPDRPAAAHAATIYSVSTEEAYTEIMHDFEQLLSSGVMIVTALVLVLAAAVARRLRDAGRSPFWGLLPLPFLTYGIVGFDRLLTNFSEEGQPFTGQFMILFFNNLAYMAALGWLILLLAKPSAAPEGG